MPPPLELPVLRSVHMTHDSSHLISSELDWTVDHVQPTSAQLSADEMR